MITGASPASTLPMKLPQANAEGRPVALATLGVGGIEAMTRFWRVGSGRCFEWWLVRQGLVHDAFDGARAQSR